MKPRPLEQQFGEWLPDQPERNNPGGLIALNVIPEKNGYRELRDLQSFTDALGDVCLGAVWLKASDGTVYNFAGDTDNLYRLVGGTTWDEISKSTDAYGASLWDFTQFGDRVIAASKADPMQYYDVGSSSVFADLSGSPPQAARVATVRDFVVAGDLSALGPNALQWCGYNNTELWTKSLATQSDYQTLKGRGGRVQRIVPGIYGLVLQEHSMTRMTYVGPPIVFQLDEVEKKRGTPSGGSVAWTGAYAYFHGWDGFYRTDGSENGSEAISHNRVSRWFSRNADFSDLSSMRTAIDRRNRLVLWAFKSDASAPINDRVLIYNWGANRWSYAEIETQIFDEFLSPGFTLDDLDTPLPSGIDIDSINVDSTAYQGGVLGLQAFNSSNQACTFDGDALEALLDTRELDIGTGKRLLVRGVRPLVEGGPATVVTVSLGTRNKLNDNVSFSIAKALNSRTGVADMMSDARYNRARVKINGGFDYATGAAFEGRETAGV